MYKPVAHAISAAINAGVPVETITLLLLLPFVSLLLAFSRNVIGVRGFGIFLPAALAVVFVAVGPVAGMGLFLVIATVSTAVRLALRFFKVRMQYLPRMSLILWFVAVSVMAVLFVSPYLGLSYFNVSIFVILILILLVEDFIKVQLGKSARTALSLTSETLFLAFVAYLFMLSQPLQVFAFQNPEIYLGLTFLGNLFLGQYAGLRVMEVIRFRRLWSGKK